MGLVLLKALLDRPMHGYELIVTLQILEERELVTSNLRNGKKLYTITEQGREEATTRIPQAPSECTDLDLEKIASLRAAATEPMNLIKVITFNGSQHTYNKAEKDYYRSLQAAACFGKERAQRMKKPSSLLARPDIRTAQL